MKNESKKTKKSVFSYIAYLVGSAALFVATVVVIPKVMTKVSGVINKELVKASNLKKNDDDLGPVIVKK